MTDITELFDTHLSEILDGATDQTLRQAAVRIYLRDLLVLTHPEEWEKQAEAVWLQGQGAIFALHCFRVAICCAVASQRLEGSQKRFNWVHLRKRTEALKNAADEGHLVALDASEVAVGQFAGKLNFSEAFEPSPTTLSDFLPSAEIKPEEMEAAVGDLLVDYTFELREDLGASTSLSMFQKALFSPHNTSEFTSTPHHTIVYFLDSFSNAGDAWNFWYDWYAGFLEGTPIDWKLQEHIALIDDAIWDAGPDAVAEAITRIKSRWEVESALTDLKASLNTQTTARHGIGGNNPPESIQDERLSGVVTLIWEAEEELSTALEQENPARQWIEAVLVKLKAALTSLLKWSAGKVNLAVGTVIVVGATKGSSVVLDTYIAKHPEKIEALIEALERWLPFLS